MMKKARIERVEHGLASLSFEDGTQADVPLRLFEGTPEPGKDVAFRAVVLGAADVGDTDFAKELINEILAGTRDDV